MGNVAIRIEGLSKKYHIGGKQKRYSHFGDQLVDMVSSPFRRAANLLKGQYGGASDLDQDFWALKDISAELKHGEIVGIIGHNGAGKSTLLKILSRITEPTTGYADIFGRVGSLLEVGTGFHPELTGRENVYLNGSILGMRRPEIDRKFDAIVDFAEVGQFIDTPVKHYSSGMYVRLAFSVAAHLEPEILLIDEVLAVGDMAFQKKSLGKMEDVSQQGRTVVFVSHNMNALQRLCPKSLLLSHGQLIAVDSTPSIIEQYLSLSPNTATVPNVWHVLEKREREGTGRVRFESFSYTSHEQAFNCFPFTDGSVEFSLRIFSDLDRSVGSLAVILYDKYGTKLINADTAALGAPVSLKMGTNQFRLRIDKLHLNPGIYTIGLWVADPPSEIYDRLPSAGLFEVVEAEKDRIRLHPDGQVPVRFSINEVD